MSKKFSQFNESKDMRSSTTKLISLIEDWKKIFFQSEQEKIHSLLLYSRRGQVVSLNLCNSNTSFHTAIFSELGAGQRIVSQAMLSECFSVGAKIYVIDMGRSYYHLCRALGGEFIELNHESDMRLNSLPKFDGIEDNLGIIQAAIEKMTSPEGGLDEYCRSRIKEAVKTVFGHKAAHTDIFDIADYMRGRYDDENQCIRDIDEMIHKYTSHGSEGCWFNSLDLSKDFVCLDLAALKVKPALQQIVLMQIISAIFAEIYMSNDGRQRVVVIDE